MLFPLREHTSFRVKDVAIEVYDFTSGLPVIQSSPAYYTVGRKFR